MDHSYLGSLEHLTYFLRVGFCFIFFWINLWRMDIPTIFFIFKNFSKFWPFWWTVVSFVHMIFIQWIYFEKLIYYFFRSFFFFFFFLFFLIFFNCFFFFSFDCSSSIVFLCCFIIISIIFFLYFGKRSLIFWQNSSNVIGLDKKA